MKRHENDPELQSITKQLKQAANMEKFDKLVRDSKLKVIDDAMKVADIRSKILKEESSIEQKKLEEDIAKAKEHHESRVKEALKNSE